MKFGDIAIKVKLDRMSSKYNAARVPSDNYSMIAIISSFKNYRISLGRNVYFDKFS